MTVVRDEVRFVFPGNTFAVRHLVRLFARGDVFGLPSFAAVNRAANIDPIAPAVVAPIAVGTQFVERDVADESVALIIVSRGNIAGDAIVGGLNPVAICQVRPASKEY